MLNKNLLDMIRTIYDPRQAILLEIYDDFKELFHHAKGSSHNHQAWKGGYGDHIAECLKINEITYNALSNMRHLGFTKASAGIVLFFHDIEKPFRYGPKSDEKCIKWQNKFGDSSKNWEKAKWEIIKELKKDYNFELTVDEINAIKYTHGEGQEHKKDERITTPLAAHAHHCDNTSARIWFDKGKGLA